MKKARVLPAPIHLSLKTTKDKTVKRMNSATSSTKRAASRASVSCKEKQPGLTFGCYNMK